MYFGLTPGECEFFPQREHFGATTDDRRLLTLHLGGNPIKNLRSVPEQALGQWLIARKGAKEGDVVEFTALENGRYFLRLLPKEVQA